MILSKSLDLALLQLASLDKALGLVSPGSLDGAAVLASDGQARGQLGQLVNVDLAHDKLDVTKNSVDLGGRSLAVGKVVDVLDGGLENTLVLLSSVLRSLLGLLLLLALGLGSLLSVLLRSLGLGLGALTLLNQTLGLLLLGLALGILAGTSLLLELLDTLVQGKALVHQLAQAGDILRLALAAGVGVLLLDVTLLVTALAVIGNILVKVFECTPAVEVVPEVVESINLLKGAVVVT